MKVAILQCDSVPGKFQSRFEDYPTMVEHMFDGLDSLKTEPDNGVFVRWIMEFVQTGK